MDTTTGNPDTPELAIRLLDTEIDRSIAQLRNDFLCSLDERHALKNYLHLGVHHYLGERASQADLPLDYLEFLSVVRVRTTIGTVPVTMMVNAQFSILRLWPPPATLPIEALEALTGAAEPHFTDQALLHLHWQELYPNFNDPEKLVFLLTAFITPILQHRRVLFGNEEMLILLMGFLDLTIAEINAVRLDVRSRLQNWG